MVAPYTLMVVVVVLRVQLLFFPACIHIPRRSSFTVREEN